MEQQIRTIINDVFYDLQEACGEDFDAESLADTVCDRMHDSSEEYRTAAYAERRAVVVRICREYT